jgi:hypothetical protein
MQYPSLYTLIEKHQVAMLPMTQNDLRAVITQPAMLPDVQLTFEGSLVGDLLFDVQGQIGALPLLQFTHLTEQCRPGRLSQFSTPSWQKPEAPSFCCLAQHMLTMDENTTNAIGKMHLSSLECDHGTRCLHLVYPFGVYCD